MNWKRFFGVVLALLVVLSIGSIRLAAQTTSTGDIAGVVSDPSNAVVPDAKVSLKDNSKGNAQDTKTSKDGAYRFYLLPSGSYTISVTASGFQTVTRVVDVNVGQIANINFQMPLGSSSQTVTVTEAPPLLQTENGNVATTMSERQVQEVPNPGNDLSFVAQTAPGVVMNTQSGFGNFAANGLPANSNLFTINGMDDNDPYLNLNNSGATNLLLGQNEIQEATVVSNGYSGQFGTLAGANITYITKSGGNDYHARAIYYWNGSAFNAQEWFSKAQGNARPFSNANQWGGDVGGPLIKDKLFWYFNSEGLRVVIPTSALTDIPSPDFEVATLKNLTANGLANSIPFYCQGTTITSPNNGSFTCPAAVPGAGQGIFNLYNAAPGAQNAVPGSNSADPIGCPTMVTEIAGPCTLNFRSQAGNFTYEYLLAARFDYNYGSKDRVFLRVQSDRGNQATYTDPVNPIFNASSFQPEYQGQLVETHTLGATAVNQFILSTTWYSAIFNTTSRAASLAALPTNVIMNDGSYAFMGGENFAFPQGRDVTQFQIADDFSKTIGNHALKFGAKFRRYDITDHSYANRSIGLIIPLSQQALFDGGGSDLAGGNFSVLQQNFPTRPTEPFAYYELAGYLEDGWRVRPNLTITGSLRIEHPSNLVCQALCFGETAPFGQLDHNANIPYNQALTTGLKKMLPGFTNLEFQPRVSFAWQPFGWHNTVIRGGIGIFYDGFQASLANNFSLNPPNFNAFQIVGDNLSPTETGANMFADAAALNKGFVTGFVTGQTVAQIQAGLPASAAGFFTPPQLTSSQAFVNAPQYQKWSLGWQQQIGRNNSIDVQYVGNHGIHEIVPNGAVNAFAPDFAGLPATAPDSRFGQTTLIQSVGVSKYNGLIVSFKRVFSQGVVNFNYSWSHTQNMGDGLEPFNFKSNTGIGYQENPSNLGSMYGPADWDVRQYVSANYVWELPIRKALMGHGWKPLVDGWQVSGTLFFRTGLPYTVLDAGLTGALSGNNYPDFGGASVFADYNAPSYNAAYTSCFGANGAGNPAISKCLNQGLFSSSTTGFGNTTRNTFFGPNFFDTDFTIMKKTKIPGWERGELGIGFQMFNVFNHPNFDQPDASLGTSNFGQIIQTVGTPTSILGSFLGGANSPRLIQLKAQVTF
jgi:hypothetical protein